MHSLYCVVDRKSSCAEYFIASCEEDAVRIWSVMALSSRPLYEYLDEFELQHVRQLPDIQDPGLDVVMDGATLRRLLDQRRKEKEDAKA